MLTKQNLKQSYNKKHLNHLNQYIFKTVHFHFKIICIFYTMYFIFKLLNIFQVNFEIFGDFELIENMLLNFIIHK